jgi:hypothetical protein
VKGADHRMSSPGNLRLVFEMLEGLIKDIER